MPCNVIVRDSEADGPGVTGNLCFLLRAQDEFLLSHYLCLSFYFHKFIFFTYIMHSLYFTKFNCLSLNQNQCFWIMIIMMITTMALDNLQAKYFLPDLADEETEAQKRHVSYLYGLQTLHIWWSQNSLEN